MYTIYKSTNKKSGKSYIGIDINWPKRKIAHKSAVTKGSLLVFHNAMRSYGVDCFEWEVLEVGEEYEYGLKEREPYFIQEHNTHYLKGNGYNMTDGGEGTFGWVPSDETKRKISEAKKGKSSWNKGKSAPWTAERNRKSKGKGKPSLYKEYLLTDPNGNEHSVIGLTKFCKEHNLHAGNLCSVANGSLNHYKGWLCVRI